jgi:hypothetical protein
LPYDLADCAKRLELDLERAIGGSKSKPHVVIGNALDAMRRGLGEEIARWSPEEDES